MLKEIAIADAWGAGFEFSDKKKIETYNNLSKYVSHDLYGFVAKYTDDTQMSIAIAELLLNDSSWTSEDIASSFVRCFKRDPRKGYSMNFYELLLSVQTGAELMERITPTSERNGAAMRSVPIGYINERSKVIQFATDQAKITHNTEIGIKSSCAVALVAHYGLILNGNISGINKFLRTEGYSDWDMNWQSTVSVHAFDTVSAALTCLYSSRSLSELLLHCVNLSGDTDSVASIAVGLATCFDEYKKDIPANLFDTLDENDYGVDFLTNLDSRLKSCFLK